MKNKEDFDAWLSDTVTMVHEQGYRVIPVYKNAPAKYAEGQTYPELEHYRGAISIGVVLDQAVLLDYDGNKADESGQEIIDLETLGNTLGLADGMPECVQEGSHGRSLHFLFTRGDRDVRMASADGWLPHIDVKTKNQLMILKPGKIITDHELPHKDELPPCPEVLLEALAGRRGPEAVPDEDAVQQAENDIRDGINLHRSALTIANSLIFEGKTAREINDHFEKLREDILQRDSQRVMRFFGGELQDIIDSGLDKYRDRVPGAGFEVVGESAKAGKVDWHDYVHIGMTNTIMRISSGAEFTVGGFNNHHKSANTWVPGKDGKLKRLTPIDYLQEFRKSQRPVFRTIYAPNCDEFFEYDLEYCLNTYKPALVPQADSNWEFSSSWRIAQDHFLSLFSDPKDGEKIIQWMAYNVQHPGEKILWAPIIKGVQGDGKSTIRNILTAVMGEKNVRDVSTNELNSQFNAYAEGCCVAALEEIRVKGHNRHEVMNTLKPLITNPIVSVVKKGQDAVQCPNTVNYIGFTNHDDALALDADDRRWGVFFTKYESREQLMADRSEDYWESLHSTYRNSRGALRGWLLNVDLEGFNPNFPPDLSIHKSRMIEQSRPIDEQEVGEIIMDYQDFFTTEQVVTDARRIGLSSINSNRVAKVARSMGYQDHRISIEGVRKRIWVSDEYYEKLDRDDNALRYAIIERDKQDTARGFPQD